MTSTQEKNLKLAKKTVKYFEERGFDVHWTGDNRPEWAPTVAGLVLSRRDGATTTVTLTTFTGVHVSHAEFDRTALDLGIVEATIRKYYEHIEKLESEGAAL